MKKLVPILLFCGVAQFIQAYDINLQMLGSKAPQESAMAKGLQTLGRGRVRNVPQSLVDEAKKLQQNIDRKMQDLRTATISEKTNMIDLLNQEIADQNLKLDSLKNRIKSYGIDPVSVGL